MAKRFIGIDIDAQMVRVALVTQDRGEAQLQLHAQSCATPDAARDYLDDLLGPPGLGDRLVTALPAGKAYYRSLQFPFKEKAKLSAALPLELSGQLPVPLNQSTIAFLPAREKAGTYNVQAVVVENKAIDSLLENFPSPEQQPRRIDLFPDALLSGLGQQEGLLLLAYPGEIVVALILSGEVVARRVLPAAERETDALVAGLVQIFEQLENHYGVGQLPLWGIGSGISAALDTQLREVDRELLLPVLDLPIENPSREFYPAVLMALGERSSQKDGGFNFRTGVYAPQGQLESMKKKLATMAVLLFLTLTTLATTAYLDYRQQARQSLELTRQTEKVFRLVMPKAKVFTAIPEQLQSQYRQLQEEARLVGAGGQASVLTVLKSISDLSGQNLKVDLKEFSFTTETLKLDGFTNSFEAVNQLTQALERSPLFSEVALAGAKTSLDGQKVDFQMQISLKQVEGAL